MSYNNTHIILIGASQFKDQELHAIPNVEQNLKELQDLLKSEQYAGIPTENIHISLNEPSNTIKRKLTDILDELNYQSTLWLYYSGHGVISDSDMALYLATKDTQRKYLDTDSLPINYIKTKLATAKAKQKILLLDCCFSGKIHEGTMSVLPDQLQTQFGKFTGTYIMSATDEDTSALFDAQNAQVPTDFTAKFLEVAKNGLSNNQPLLSFAEIFQEIKHDFQRRGKPIPKQSNTDDGSKIALLKNLRFDALKFQQEYRELFEDCYEDEIISPAERRVLKQKQKFLGLSDEQVEVIEKYVINLFEEKKKIDAEHKRQLEELKKAQAQALEQARKREQETLRKIEEEKQKKILAEKERLKKEQESIEKAKKAEKSQKPQSYTETINGVEFKMIYVEGGEFMMGDGNGSSDEKPAHRVELDGFYMAEFEVTQELWRAVMGSDPPELYNKGCDKCPVERVSWKDVQEFIQKLNEKTGKNYHLPSEAQWEYAARGGRYSKGYQYAGSNNLDEVAWYWKNSGDKKLSGDWDYDKIKANNCRTHPVGQKKPNELGLYDMSGNVWEWCEDAYDYDFYSKPEASLKNPVNRSTATSRRVNRGGDYFGYAEHCQVRFRLNDDLVHRHSLIGFRVSF